MAEKVMFIWKQWGLSVWNPYNPSWVILGVNKVENVTDYFTGLCISYLSEERSDEDKEDII